MMQASCDHAPFNLVARVDSAPRRAQADRIEQVFEIAGYVRTTANTNPFVRPPSRQNRGSSPPGGRICFWEKLNISRRRKSFSLDPCYVFRDNLTD
jgi:hypothetical protein